MNSELSIYGGTTAMEVQKGSKSWRITLEQYLDFFHSRKQFDLSAGQLRQIIQLHGFKWHKQIPKEGRAEAVRSIELTEPARTTTNGNGANISSGAFITLEEAIKDLSLLKWQECCVTSLQTLNSVTRNGHLTHTTTVATPTSSNKKKSSSSRSKKKASTPAAASAITDEGEIQPKTKSLKQLTETEPSRLTTSGDVETPEIISALPVVLPVKRKKGIR